MGGPPTPPPDRQPLTGNPYIDLEATALKHVKLHHQSKRAKVPTPEATRAAKRSRRKGVSGEQEVVRLYRAYGWEKAHRQPGSGGMRPYGARDLSPWPGDVGGVKPWLVEVKRTKYVLKAGRGWPGEAFIRATLKELDALHQRHRLAAGALEMLPVLWARGDTPGVKVQWRVFVPDYVLLEAIGHGVPLREPHEWVELEPDEYFSTVAGEPWPG